MKTADLLSARMNSPHLLFADVYVTPLRSPWWLQNERACPPRVLHPCLLLPTTSRRFLSARALLLSGTNNQ